MFEVTLIPNRPAHRPRPANLAGYHRYSNGQIDVFVHKKDVLQAIADWARRRSDEEIAGRLVGRPYRDDRGVWAVITGHILARYEGGPANVRTTADDAEDIARAMEQDYPCQELMGWYHSHICDLDKYSSTDKANQADWQKPYHVGLLAVVRAKTTTIHAFRGPEAERLDHSYVCDADRRQEPEKSSTSGPPSPSTRTEMVPVLPTPSSRGWIGSLAHLALWPVIFLIGIQMLADGVARIHLPVVNQKTDDWEPVAEKMDHTVDVVESLVAEVEGHTLQTEQQLEAYRDRYGAGLSMLNWIADRFAFSHSEAASENDIGSP